VLYVSIIQAFVSRAVGLGGQETHIHGPSAFAGRQGVCQAREGLDGDGLRHSHS